MSDGQCQCHGGSERCDAARLDMEVFMLGWQDGFDEQCDDLQLGSGLSPDQDYVEGWLLGRAALGIWA